MILRRLRAAVILCAMLAPALAQESDTAAPSPEAPSAAQDPPPAASSSEGGSAAEPSAQAGDQPAPDSESGDAGAETAPAAAADTVAVEPVRAVAESAEPAEAVVLLDAVEVTAQRRRQRLQDVPVSVTAMTRDQIESRGIGRLDDLNSLAPGLQISRSPSNSTISQITLRGSSQINPAIYWDPAVGVYLDGVYIGKGQGSIFDIVNLEGVEVLRGPQGTLYGRNTIGGTINFVTREPSGTFSGSAALDFSNYQGKVQRASLDLPRLGIADITVGARHETRDGWVTTTPGSSVPELNNRDSSGFTLAALLAPAEGIEAIYRFDFTDIDQVNIFDQLYRYDRPELAQYVHQDRQTVASVDGPSLEQSRIHGHAFTLGWDLSDTLTLKSISGYRKVQWTDFLDLDGSPQPVAHTKRITDYRQLSQDLNLTARGERWAFTGGAYYFRDDGYTDNPQTFYFGALNFDSRYGTRSKAWAGYGQLDWQPLEPLTLTAGVRYTRESKVLDRVLGVTPVSPATLQQIGMGQLPAPAAPQPFVYYVREGFTTPEAVFTATTPAFSIAWRFNEQINAYLRQAEGFKSGGYNGEYSNLQDTPADNSPATSNDNETQTRVPFRPERQKSLELGLKTSFFGGRALLNVAAFRNKLTDLQVSTFSGQGAAASTISNAGQATVKGLELESALMPFDGTQLRANIAWLRPEYTEFIDAGENVADNRAFVHAPEKSYNLVLDSRLFGGGWGELRVVADYVWTDAFYTYPYQLQPDPNPPGQQKQEAEDTRVPATGLLNARLSVSGIPLGGTLAEIALWGRNLADEDAPSNFIDFGPGLFASLTCANFVEPRTVGLSAILRW